jgi:hypothetical protein
MRLLTFIVIIFFIACNDSSVDISKTATKTLWVDKDLKFDTLSLDTTSMIVHGSGTILYFDTTAIFKSFANDLYTNNDSLTWGEPGIELNYGKWKKSADKIIVDKQLVERTFLMPDQKIGMKQVDTFHIVGDTLVRNNKSKFIAVKLVSKEIRDFLNQDWSYWKKKNGM